MQVQHQPAQQQNEDQPLVAKWQCVNAGNGPSPRPRHGHKAVSIKDLIIVYGGGNEGIFDDLYVYNTSSDKWYKPNIRGDGPPGLAAFGMCCDGERIFIFGGMIDPNHYSNDLYELDTRRWEYKMVRVRPPRTGGQAPCPRFGHSFNIDSDGYGYIFGGYTNAVPGHQYLDDFYRVKLDSALGVLSWELLPAGGPSARESHSAVVYEDQGQKQLILYGGMNGERLSDIWICDLRNMVWQQIEQHGIAPLGRSLHSANLLQNRMYVFGGWIPVRGEELPTSSEQQAKPLWKCSNDLACFNLKTNEWEAFAFDPSQTGEQLPKSRAGHSAVSVHSRLYIWSGREGIRRIMNSQICCNDMYFLETSPPSPPEHLQLVRATMSGVEIQWAVVPTATEYLLQIYKVPSVDAETPVNPPLPNILQSRGARTVRPAGPGSQPNAQNGQVTRFYLTSQNNSVVRMVASHPSSTNNGTVPTPNAPVQQQSIPASTYPPQSVPQQMPNNILDESFHDSIGDTLDEEASNTNASNASKIVDPSSISLSDSTTTEPPTPAPSAESTLDATSATSASIQPPNDPEPSGDDQRQSIASEASAQEPSKDVPADPQSDNVGQEAERESPTTPNNTPLNGQIQPIEQQEETWHDVGIIKTTTYLVTHYFIDDNPNEAERRKAGLEPGTQYKFRVAAINSCGQSAWSPEASFRTCIPGYPGAPSSIKITKGTDCARLNWAPPSTPNGNICEYSVYLAMRTPDTGSPFLRVYAGQEPSCTVPNKTLNMALIDNTPKPAVIFRIAARNEKGYGPATQVRWLQDNRAPPRPSPMQNLHPGGPGASYNKRIRLD